MTKKKILQFCLFLFSLIILIIILKIYLNKNLKISEVELDGKIIKNLIPIEASKEANIIKDIIYSATDKNENEYIIKANYGTIDSKNSAIIDMVGVTATIYLKDKNEILILSKKAIYNDTTYDTRFIEDVIVTYENNKIEGNNLDLFFTENLMSVYDKVIYNNDDMILHADQIDMDLTTKDTKTFMNNILDKVNINSKKK